MTNVRDGRRYAGRRSRGELVTHFLTSEGPLTDFTGWLSRHGGDFAPFNLVFGRVDALYVYHSPTRELRRLTRGIHGISNGRPDAGWPKVERLNSHLRGLARLPAEDSVFEWLADREEAPLAQLPNTGVGAGLERLLSPVFIAGRDYGTRASSFLVVDAQGRVRFTEQSGTPAAPTGGVRFNSVWSPVHVLLPPDLPCPGVRRVIRCPGAAGWPAKFPGRLGRKSAVAGIRCRAAGLARC